MSTSGEAVRLTFGDSHEVDKGGETNSKLSMRNGISELTMNQLLSVVGGEHNMMG